MSLHNLKKQARKILNQNHEVLIKRQIKKLSSPQQKEQLKKQGFEDEKYTWYEKSPKGTPSGKRPGFLDLSVIGWQKKYPKLIIKSPKYQTEEQSQRSIAIQRKLDKLANPRYLSKINFVNVYGEDVWEKNKDNYELFTYQRLLRSPFRRVL